LPIAARDAIPSYKARWWHDSHHRATVRKTVHIPDGFLSTPVWAALDVAAVPCVAYAVRRAQRAFDDARVPLLGVMGAFVFAAQMINFPVGVGTSSHLLGGALLAFTLGPAAACVVMTAILAIQALVFQDGGILALGPNILNMAIVGVLAGYLPYHLFGAGRWRRAAIFAGGALSVLATALLAMTQLLASGVPLPAAALGVSFVVFLISAALEGAITLAVVQALESIQPSFVRRPAARSAAMGMLAIAAVLMAGVGVVFASSAPDGIQKLTRFDTEADPGWLAQAAAGLGGVALIYAACLVFGRFAARRRSV
jgi:cobalt/nickel transport system permease protein